MTTWNILFLKKNSSKNTSISQINTEFLYTSGKRVMYYYSTEKKQILAKGIPPWIQKVTIQCSMTSVNYEVFGIPTQILEVGVLKILWA